MKAQLFILLIVAIVISSTYAQCRQPANQICAGPKDEGISGWRQCRPTITWWYNSRQRQCLRMTYKGCGGNNNRYCSLSDCQRRCGSWSG